MHRIFAKFSPILILILAACSEPAPEAPPPAPKIQAAISYGLPPEIDATATGPLDWWMITSENLQGSDLVAFDQRIDADFIQSASVELSGGKTMSWGGVTSYHWSDGTVYTSLSEIGPGVSTGGSDRESSAKIVVKVRIPKDAVKLILHGKGLHGTPFIEAELEETKASTPIALTPYQFTSWAYELEIRHAAGKTVTLTINSSSTPEFTSSLTFSGIFLAPRP